MAEEPGTSVARVIFAGNTELPVGGEWDYAGHIKTWFEAGTSSRKGGVDSYTSNFDIQWPAASVKDVLLDTYFKETYKVDFSKNAHGAVCLFGEAELKVESFDATLFSAQLAALLSGFARVGKGTPPVAITLLPQKFYLDVSLERWQAVDTAIRTAAATAGANLVDLTTLYEEDKDLADNTTKARRRIAEEIFLAWYIDVEKFSVIDDEKDIPVTPQQKWTNGAVIDKDGSREWTGDGNGNQDFTKYSLIKKIAEKGESEWPQVIFTGDSITDLMDGSYDKSEPTVDMSNPWKTYIGYNDAGEIGDGTAKTYRALNFGNSGDFTQSLLFRWQNLSDQYSGAYTGAFKFKDTVKAVVVNIGTNNIGPSKPTSETSNAYNYQERPISSIDTVRGIQAVVELMKKEFPKAEIIVMGLFPRGEFTTSARRDSMDFLRLQVLSVNRQLENLYANDKDSRVTYLYLYESFVDDAGTEKTGGSYPGFTGNYNKLFYDSLHPNNAGYKIWWDNLTPIFADLGIK